MKWVSANKRLPGWKQVVRWRVNGVQRNTPQSISMFQYQGLIDIDDFEWCEEDSYPPEAARGQRELPDCKNCKAQYEKCECGKYESLTTADASVLINQLKELCREYLDTIEKYKEFSNNAYANMNPKAADMWDHKSDGLVKAERDIRKLLAQYSTQSLPPLPADLETTKFPGRKGSDLNEDKGTEELAAFLRVGQKPIPLPESRGSKEGEEPDYDHLHSTLWQAGVNAGRMEPIIAALKSKYHITKK